MSKRSMKTERALPLVLLGLLLALAGGCTEAGKARFEANQKKMQREMAEKALQERATEYWDFARWYSWAETAVYYERSEDQLKHLQDGTARDEASLPKIDAVEIQYVFVDPETRKTGEVRVRWKQFTPGTSGVQEATRSQRWYKRSGQWWLAPESGIPDDEYDELGDEDRSSVEDMPPLETVVPDGAGSR